MGESDDAFHHSLESRREHHTTPDPATGTGQRYGKRWHKQSLDLFVVRERDQRPEEGLEVQAVRAVRAVREGVAHLIPRERERGRGTFRVP